MRLDELAMICLRKLTYSFSVLAAPLGDAGCPHNAASAMRVKSRRFVGLWRGPARRVGGATRAACIPRRRCGWEGERRRPRQRRRVGTGGDRGGRSEQAAAAWAAEEQARVAGRAEEAGGGQKETGAVSSSIFTLIELRG